jgi:hypothetical protein
MAPLRRQPSERRDNQGLDTGFQGRMDHRGKLGAMVDWQPIERSGCFGLSIGFRISTPDEPEDRRNMPERAETAEVLARRRRPGVVHTRRREMGAECFGDPVAASSFRLSGPGSVPPGAAFPVRARQAVTTAMPSQPNARQFVDMRIMSTCAARSRPQTDEVIRSGIHVDVTHAGVGHGAARVVGREPPHDRSFAARRGVEIDRSPVAMHRGMMGACDHGARPARRDNLHRAKLGLDPVQQLARFTIQARSRNADVIMPMV